MGTVANMMTVEQFLALPNDGIDRELIRGELRERGLVVRSRFHSRVMATLAMILGGWYEGLPSPRGDLLVGNAGFRLEPMRDTLVGIDVAYASAELAAATPPEQLYYLGSPVLAVEILSPSDTYEDVIEKVELYLEAGASVWIVDPHFRTVTVHRPGRPAEPLGAGDQLSGEPELPGFSVAIETLFQD